MTILLGINAFHADSSAVLIKDGTILCAVEEERFKRIKHCAGFPVESIQWCLNDAGIRSIEIDHICINTNPKAHQFKKLIYAVKTQANLRFLWNRWKNKRERSDLKQQLINAFPDQAFRGKVHYVEHHRAHLASAFYASSFDHASVVSVDGFGDFASAAWGFGSETSLDVYNHIYFPHSLGAFYTAITQFLGFPNYGDEYKVMGLAPYGEPRYMKEMHQIVFIEDKGSFRLNLTYFQHSGKKDLPHQWSQGSPVVGRHWSRDLEDLLGPARTDGQPLEQRHMDIAKSAQLIYELAFLNLLNHLYNQNNCPNLCIAGGCGANSVANGKILQQTPFKQVYVQAAAGDAGGALGAALDVWHQLGHERSKPMKNAYLGYRPKENDINDLLSNESIKRELAVADCTVTHLDDNAIYEKVSDAIIQGLVIGWYEGRMEWGPRALGHRSILGDPRRSDMKDILNLKIKRRESFRPFAPSILREAVGDWFETDANVPFMMQVFSIKEEKRDCIPAVTHVDGSGRLQTVTAEENGRYYDLIKAFYQKTGVPIILNTSFNENEPIVCTPRQALDCFLRTKMDILVIENVLIQRLQ
ncbi:MAG: carbamoyltransferase C-terminal domain-containing protein [Cyanobacteriota bacterium]|nr:carbamoyltransferase C-terminal domain-containing protein [Cyanobacteriota bacterium]